MPTDIVELCIAACCIFGMALVRSKALVPRDGLDRATRAIATGMACTVLLAITNSTAFLLNSALLPHTSLQPSTLATMHPLFVMAIGAVVVVIAIAITQKIHAALHQLLASLAAAIVQTTLLLAAVTALLAPPQNIFHAMLTAVGAGFGFTLLLQLCVMIVAPLDAARLAATAAPRQKSPLRATLLRIAEDNPAPTLLLGGLLAVLAVALNATR
jgi:Na+-translocating ferredoxin:NAD+ oxidoreductase RnfA subunit